MLLFPAFQPFVVPAEQVFIVFEHLKNVGDILNSHAAEGFANGFGGAAGDDAYAAGRFAQLFQLFACYIKPASFRINYLRLSNHQKK